MSSSNRKHETVEEGWFFPYRSKRWHYYREGRSLCRRWMLPGELQADDGKTNVEDCIACRRKLEREKGEG